MEATNLLETSVKVITARFIAEEVGQRS